MTGPLESVRVLELAALGPVPFLGMFLSDLGATVVRIDKLHGPGNDGRPALLPSAIERGRRPISLDLQRDGASEIVLRLVERSDILIEGFRPGVAERLGIGPDVALARNPALVYGRMTGWGQDGPLALRAGHDINYLAVSGVLHGIGEKDRAPVPPVNYLADYGGGAMVLASGILAALLNARTTGEGQVVDAAMTEGAAYLSTLTRQMMAAGKWTDARQSNLLDGGAPNYRCYQTLDDRYMAVGALEPKFWEELVRGMDAEADQVPSPYSRDQWEACARWLTEKFRTRTRDEWTIRFQNFDACVTPVLSLTESVAHPHNQYRGAFVDIAGATVSAPVPKFSATRAAPGAVTEIDTSTESELNQLGFDNTQRAKLRAAHVIN